MLQKDLNFLPRLARGIAFVTTNAVLVRKSRRTFGTHKPKPPLCKGSLIRAVLLRIVGSGFCPIVRGHPRAMLAPDASVGKAEKQLYQGVLDIPNNELIIVFSENYAIIELHR